LSTLRSIPVFDRIEPLLSAVMAGLVPAMTIALDLAFDESCFAVMNI
jgi:hypothetical protein